MAEEACHGFGSTTQVGLTQTLGESRMAATKEHFSAAAQEVDAGSIDAGLWAMATARARGDVTVTGAIYLELRAEELSQARAHEHGRLLVNAAKEKIEHIGNSAWQIAVLWFRSEEHTSELHSLMRISSAVFFLKKKN